MDAGKSIATAPVKGVPFSKSTAREPSFEGQVGDGEDREGQILDIDYGQAKDMVQGRHRNRAPQLYRKVRYLSNSLILIVLALICCDCSGSI